MKYNEYLLSVEPKKIGFRKWVLVVTEVDSAKFLTVSRVYDEFRTYKTKRKALDARIHTVMLYLREVQLIAEVADSRAKQFKP